MELIIMEILMQDLIDELIKRVGLELRADPLNN